MLMNKLRASREFDEDVRLSATDGNHWRLTVDSMSRVPPAHPFFLYRGGMDAHVGS